MLIDVLFALLIAVLCFVLIWSIQPGRRSPRSQDRLAGLLVFLLMFLLIWAGGMWMNPVGPPWWGSPWISFLLVGLVVGLLAAAFLTPKPGGTSQPSAAMAQTDVVVSAGIYFWLLLLVLIVAIAVRYWQ